VRTAVALLAVACLAVAGCAGRRGDRHFAAGDYGAAIDAYESALGRRPATNRRDAAILLRLALAHAALADAEEDRPDLGVGRGDRHLRLLISRFPSSAEASAARRLLAAGEARRRAGRLAAELVVKNERLARLDAVLRLVAEAESRLRLEVENRDEARADLEGRLAALARRARDLAAEVAELESELAALKRIDTAGDPGPEDPS